MLESALVVGILIAVCILMDVAILGLAKILPQRNPTPVKIQRFEAGNPPLGVPKFVMPMQYMGFMVMFMALEPILVLFLLISAYPSVEFAYIVLLSIILIIPPVYIAYNYALEIAMIRRGVEHG